MWAVEILLEQFIHKAKLDLVFTAEIYSLSVVTDLHYHWVGLTMPKVSR